MEITETITIDVPMQRVWDLTLDIDDLPDITPTITAVERLDEGPLNVGSRVRLQQPGLPARVWTVEVVDAPRRFVWATTLLGVRMAGVHELEQVDAGTCRLTLRVQLEGRGASLLGRLGGRNIARALAQEADGFRTAALAAAGS